MMYGPPSGDDKCQVFQSCPEHVRKHLVEILKTGNICQEWLSQEDILCYLALGSISFPLKNACEDILLERLTRNNCVDALVIADRFDLLRLSEASTVLITNNFGIISTYKSFTCLNDCILEKLCSIEKIAKHPGVYQALEWWLEFKHETRFTFYCKLLEIVRFHRSHSKRIIRKRHYSLYHALFMIDTTKAKHAILTAVFNSDGDLVCHRKLFKTNDIKHNFAHACDQKDESEPPYVYISSGKHVIRYDPMLNKHVNCAHLIHSRSGSSLVSINGILYALGGHDHHHNITEIEEIDLRTCSRKSKFTRKPAWKVVSKKPQDLKLNSAPCVIYNNKAYLVGESKLDGQNATAVIMFNPVDKTIKTIAEFPTKSSNVKAVVLESNIFIAASEGHFLKFDINTNLFTSCPDLLQRCQNFTMYAENDRIYLFSSVRADINCGRIEMNEYDINTKSWRHVKQFPCNLPIYGCCDMKVPSYANVIPFYDTNFQEINLSSQK